MSPQARRKFLRTLVMSAGLLGTSLLGFIPVLGGWVRRLRPPAPGAGAGSPDWQRATWELVFDWDRGGRPDDPYARGGEGFSRLRVHLETVGTGAARR